MGSEVIGDRISASVAALVNLLVMLRKFSCPDGCSDVAHLKPLALVYTKVEL